MAGFKMPTRRTPVASKRKTGNDPSTASDQAIAETTDEHYHDAIRQMDRQFRKNLTILAGPVDIPAFLTAGFDRYIHLLFSPAAAWHQLFTTIHASMRIAADITNPCQHQSEIETDSRFKAPDWSVWPYAAYASIFLTLEAWHQERLRHIRGIAPHSAEILSFLTKQWTEMLNPANFPATNPRVIKATINKNGRNLQMGLFRFLENLIRNQGHLFLRHSREQYFAVGETLATSFGCVCFRNDLIELIQYHPLRKTVREIPILLVPAWINKYYILDLQTENSMVQYLLNQGFQVFVISWKNIDHRYQDYGFISYTEKGTITAIREILKQTGAPSVHLTGYCMGGTLAAITAARLRSLKDTSIRSLTFFAGQLDFSDAGELRSFIDESQISLLEDLMEDEGYLEKQTLAQTFSLLNARDLFWHAFISEFYLTEEPVNNDFLYWNDDATRMPRRLHMELLRSFYLNDDLTEGKFRVDGSSIDLRDIDMDLYSVGTLRDHIAPWHSVYRIPHFVSSPIKFVLASSGHIAGIIRPPSGGTGFYYTDGVLGKGPVHWLSTATRHTGTWWEDWREWLLERSGEEIPPPPLSAEAIRLDTPAPGLYVFEK